MPQNIKIKEIEEKMEKLRKDNVEFKNEINNKFDEFIKTYQETNKKLIEMVEELIGGRN